MGDKILKSLQFPGSTNRYKIPQSDYAQTDSTQPDYIKNKLVGKEVTYSDTLTWDGNTAGLIADSEGVNYLVSETLPTFEEFSNGGKIIMADGSEISFSSEYVADLGNGAITISGVVWAIYENNVDADGIVFSKAGLYFTNAGGQYIKALTVNNFAKFLSETTKKLTAEYLEPFEVVTKGGDTLTWDGDTSGKYFVEGDLTACCITNVVPTMNDFKNGCTVALNEGTVMEIDSASIMDTGDGVLMLGNAPVYVIQNNNYNLEGIIFENKGIYFGVNDGFYPISLTIPNYTGFATTEKKLKGEYLSQPDFNQNDSSKPDYIKNRPFYSEEIIVFSRNNISFDNSMGILAAFVSPVNALLGEGIYIVNWDEQTYECESVFADGMYAIGNIDFMLTGGDNGMPFVIMTGDMGDGAMSAVIYDINGVLNGETASTHNISVSGENHKTIDEKYIPAIAKMCDFDVEEGLTGSVKNKPLNRSLINTLMWDGDISGKETYTLYDGGNGYSYKLCRIQNEPIYSDFSGGNTHYIESDGMQGVNAEMQETIYDGYVTALYENSSLVNAQNVACVNVAYERSGRTFYGITLPKGFYIGYKTDKNNNIVRYFNKIECYSTRRLPSSYLPNRMRTTSVEVNYIILRSNGGDGAKHFKITVSDNGTLTATEI